MIFFKKDRQRLILLNSALFTDNDRFELQAYVGGKGMVILVDMKEIVEVIEL